MYFTTGNESINLTRVSRMTFSEPDQDGKQSVCVYYGGGPAYQMLHLTAAEAEELRATIKQLSHPNDGPLEARQEKLMNAVIGQLKSAAA